MAHRDEKGIIRYTVEELNQVPPYEARAGGVGVAAGASGVAGGTGGALAGAALGSAFGPVGTLGGGIAGATVGGTAAGQAAGNPELPQAGGRDSHPESR